jgi:ssDNA-binding Zn-finger/Zn-ribbon topoisomerase 1
MLLYTPMQQNQDTCPKCGSPLKDAEETKTGKKLQRCSKGTWNSQTRQTEGCDYVKWLEVEPKTLDEVCPKCGSPLVLQVTRTGKKMKKCSTSGWDRDNRVATGCDYVEWLNGSTETLDEECPLCGEKLVLFTTNSGKKMKKCSTAGWDREFRQPTGCTYVEWMK